MNSYRKYRKISDISQIQKLRFSSSRHAVVFVQYIEAMCQVENEDVVGASSVGAEWLTILLPTKVCLILEVLQ